MNSLKERFRAPLNYSLMLYCQEEERHGRQTRLGRPVLRRFRGRRYYRCRLGRTVTETDNIWFTLLTNNTNQIHFNNEYGKRTEFGKCLINSALTLAIVAGMGVCRRERERLCAGLGRDQAAESAVCRRHAVFGIRSVGERESKSKPQWGIIKVRTRGIQQEGKVVIDYARSVMVWKKAHAPKNDLFPEIKEDRK